MSTATCFIRKERTARIDQALVSAFLDNIPDRVFFKDRDSRFIAASRSLVRHLGKTEFSEIVGRTDFDFFGEAHARATYADEQRILATGDPILGQLEPEDWPDGRITWALTNKLPLRGEYGEIIGTFGLSRDVTATKEMEAALETAQQQLVDASRTGGMAEIANGVLHNVGNVLNSLNVSASVIATGLRQSKSESVTRLVALLREHESDLGGFLTRDPKGRRVPELLASLAGHASDERTRLLQEIASLQKNVDHIKEVVAMQQAYATMGGRVEPLDPVMLMEHAVSMNVDALARHEVEIVRRFQTVPAMLGEKAKVLQILVNLISNAKHACGEAGRRGKRITLSVAPAATPGHVCLAVEDNGIGIPKENLAKIFGHGFTTRANGHGFGLHSAANAAREMKGSLTVRSEGWGLGATFTLELPVPPPARRSP